MNTLQRLLAYIHARLGEPSTYRGILVAASALSGILANGKVDWRSAELLEALTWGGLLVYGLIQVLVPQKVLYSTDDNPKS